MIRYAVITFMLIICFFSCAKEKNTFPGVDDKTSVQTDEKSISNNVAKIDIDEAATFSINEKLMEDAGKIFYITEDVFLDGFSRKAQVYTEENGDRTVYLTIKESIIYDKNGTILMDGSQYGPPFYAWKIENFENHEAGFYIFCYWGSSGVDATTTDPVLFEYDESKDELYIWRIDPALY